MARGDKSRILDLRWCPKRGLPRYDTPFGIVNLDPKRDPDNPDFEGVNALVHDKNPFLRRLLSPIYYHAYQTSEDYEGYGLMIDGVCQPQYLLTGSDINSLLGNLDGKLSDNDQALLERSTLELRRLTQATDEEYKNAEQMHAARIRGRVINLKNLIIRRFRIPSRILVGGGVTSGREKYFLPGEDRLIVVPLTKEQGWFRRMRIVRNFAESQEATNKEWTDFLSLDALLETLPKDLKQKITVP